MISLKLLNKKEREEINLLMHKLESKSIYPVLVIAKESDPYPGALLRVTVLLAIVMSLVFVYLFSIQFEFLNILLPLFFILLILPLVRIFNLKRLALSKGEVTREVSEKAYEEYFKFSLNGQEIERQIFIYLSLLENRFEIIFGSQLNKEIKDSTKEQIATKLIERFKEKNYSQAIIQSLETMLDNEIPDNFSDNPQPEIDKKSVKNRIFFS